MSQQNSVHIVVLGRDTFAAENKLAGPSQPHTMELHASTSPEQVAGRIAGANIVVTSKVPITAAALKSAPRLKFIAVAATGYDLIDVAACKGRGIAVRDDFILTPHVA